MFHHSTTTLLMRDTCSRQSLFTSQHPFTLELLGSTLLLMDSKMADSGFRAEALDLSAEKARDVSRTARNGVCLIPYMMTILIPRGVY